MSDTIEWPCSACQSPVGDGAGQLWVDGEQQYAVEQALKEWNREHHGTMSARDLHAYPDPAPWQVTHYTCTPEGTSVLYGIEVHRIRTYRQLVGWTAHLSEKAWLETTNWSDLLRRLSGGQGPGTS